MSINDYIFNVFAFCNPYNIYKWYNNIIFAIEIYFLAKLNINSPSIKSKNAEKAHNDLIRIELICKQIVKWLPSKRDGPQMLISRNETDLICWYPETRRAPFGDISKRDGLHKYGDISKV